MPNTFLCIGAGPGIGLATAQRFAREGFRVVLAARNLERLRRQADELEGAGVKVEIRQLDATQPLAVADLVSDVGGNLQVLHYNAGVLHYSATGALSARTIDDESLQSLDADTQINLTSALVAIKSALPALEKQKNASVLLTGGGLGIQPSGDFLTLSVGKAALRAAGQALFEPLKLRGIHVATVTVSRLVSPESPHANSIAEEFWKLHAQEPDRWTYETIYS